MIDALCIFYFELELSGKRSLECLPLDSSHD